MIRDIHLIIFSPLHNYDGGRETWLNLFVPKLINQLNGAVKLRVYYYIDSKTDNGSLIDSINKYPDCFYPISVPLGGGLIKNFSRVLIFNFQAFRQINRNQTKPSLVLGIGSFYEAIIPYLLSWRIFSKGRPVSGIWLRSILEKQLGALKSTRQTKFWIGLESLLLKKMDVVIANGWDTSKHYKDANQIDSVIIPNAVDLTKYEKIPGISKAENKLKIAFIGRLSPEKGFLVFLESIRVFNCTYPALSNQIVFEVVGAGPLSVELENGRVPNLVYKGVLSNNEIPSFLGEIHCGVALTSSSNVGGGGVSHGLLELLASGRIVLASDSYIYRQVAADDEVLYVKEDDPNSLAEAYHSILTNTRDYIEMAERGRSCSQKFSIASHVQQFIHNILERAL